MKPDEEAALRLGGERLAPDSVLAIGEQIAAALAELHRRGAWHLGVRLEAIGFDAVAQRAWLVDAGAASNAGRPAPPSLGVDRLAWVAPEQTGRIDRAADQRSDLYSLGLVLHRLLTGVAVLRSSDPLEWIHWHLAGLAPDPAQLDPKVPPVLAAIVMKLLAKSPDERYQSAVALREDLARCAGEWAAHGRVEPFILGRRDVGRQLSIANRLYGREREVQTLLDAFAATCDGEGSAGLLLVEGYAGIGKTALIEQMYRPIVRRHGYFIAGKFDQVVRGVPFGALIQAFRGLVRQLLGESEARLEAWRDTLLAALGGNGGVLAEVIPEIGFIVGAQPVPPLLGAIEAQNRFQRVLQNFVAALADPAHPLVIFLDDLQWADAATLGLLEPLLAAAEMRGLMLIGAYRDHELESAPHLLRALAGLEAGGVAPQRIALGPLGLAELSQLVADTLLTRIEEAEPLARLVLGKTGGNPFFVTQFLKGLEREGHVRFDDERGRWTWRIEQIADAPLADNVVDLMTRSIARLPARSQYALTLAACIGNRFDEGTLALVSEQSEAATAADLSEAIGEGLVVRVAGDQAGTPAFAFLHDRVQQAAYALIPEERRQRLHLSVGRLLREREVPGEIESRRLFDIVHHLDLGLPLIAERAERVAVAALNLEAGRRAKSSTAHEAALGCFEAGHGLLDASAWEGADYELAFGLGLELAESRYLCGRFDAAHELMAYLTARARTAIDRARVVRLRSVQYENMARYADALGNAREGLALFGLALPDAEADKEAALEDEIAAIELLRGDRAIAALVELPVMRDAGIRMVMTMLTDVWSAAYIIGDPTLARLISATLVRLSLEHGNVEESAYGYVTHAITVGPMRGDYAAADEWGMLALAVNQRFDDLRRRAKIHQQFHAHVALWCRPFETCIAHAREACRSGLESGDFLYAAYGAGTETWPAMLATQDLAQFDRDYSPSVALIERLKNTGFADSVRVILGWSRALQGLTVATLSLGDASFDEAAYVRRYADNPFFTTIHAVMRLQLCCLLGSAAEALQAAAHSARTAHLLQGTIWPVVHDFWHGLASAACAGELAPAARATLLDSLRQRQSSFAAMAGHCARNYRCQVLLLGAEIARLEGNEGDAAARCVEAIEFAAAHRLVPYEALGHEMSARLHEAAGRARLAALHFAAAREAYAEWGASAKVAALDRDHPARGRGGDARSAADASPAPAEPVEPVPRSADGLDLHSVMKAAQVIAAEVEYGALLARLMQIAIENAGAEHGALVVESEAGPLVWAAESDADSGVARYRAEPFEGSQSVPAGIVNYVRRTGESVVLAEPGISQRHGDDSCIAARRPRSLACVPVQRQGRTIGALYLDNSRVAGAFSGERVEILRILAAQAAIALENARLVTGLKQEIEERSAAQDQLGTALAEVERLRQDLEAENSYLRRDLIANVSHDLRTPLVSLRGYLEVLAAKGESLLPAQRASYLAIAVRQSEHLARLIDQLFELAKLDFKDMTLNREAFPLGELANDVMQKFQLAADGHGVRLQVESLPDLPHVDADLSLVERVLENLIGNALRYTPSDGSVVVRLAPSDGGVRVEVADTGRGIAAADLPFVFDRHWRSGATRDTASAGAGLGLAISKRILELHGSAIDVESVERQGTRFSFCLPVDRQARH